MRVGSCCVRSAHRVHTCLQLCAAAGQLLGRRLLLLLLVHLPCRLVLLRGCMSQARWVLPP